MRHALAQHLSSDNPSTRDEPMGLGMLALVLSGLGAVAGAIAFDAADKSAATGAAVGVGVGLGLVALGELEDRLKG